MLPGQDHGPPHLRMGESYVGPSEHRQLHRAQGRGRFFASLQMPMEVEKQRRGRIVVDLPQRPRDAARAGQQKGPGQAGHAGYVLRLAAERSSGIDLLVTDMVMPGMTGPQLAGRLQQQHGPVGVIYMSGYSEHAAAEAAQSDPSVRLLTKPFSRSAILRAAREILGVAAKR